MVIDPTAFDAAVTRQSFTGVVTVDVGDQRVFERCEGFLNRALDVPMTPRARIAIASGSKSFTALAVMRLVEDGAVQLGQTTCIGSGAREDSRAQRWLGPAHPVAGRGVPHRRAPEQDRRDGSKREGEAAGLTS
ncbi:serine hydrolase [Tessaracoccus sp. ZS01]|uniref:serine hydrolase n=1 Tax=Tessaracoccus sp. ZS01 TaxID=1906324 RepID=UPI00096C7B37|nr:serine hydrolase domain-containing protein [Tessaracoccus sp. ZS01]MCG6567718.1 hypothetical protein [Tessaracoccus sp. ZS01]OMG55789.1 hypothetical protein BJN44_08845 [Tessaracoccus sp. ZS01]